MLPIFTSGDRILQMLQTQWASAINPLLALPLTRGVQLKEVPLVVGPNVINHRLGRKLQGWIITRKRAAGSFYDTQDINQSPELTLNLNSDAAVIVDIWVY